MRKLTIDDFIKISNDRHNHKYDYSMTIYINSQSRVDILCKEHGIFRQLANAHMRGQGCPKCNGGVKYETIDFIKKGNREVYHRSPILTSLISENIFFSILMILSNISCDKIA